MKKFRFLPVVFLLLSIHCIAQKNDVEDAHSLLWRISGKGLTHPSYLFGTIHIICPQDYIWTDAMKKSFNSSDKICFEMKMDDPNLLATASAMFMDTTGKQLKDYFTPDEYTLVRKYFSDSLKIDISYFQQMKPIMIQTLMGTRNVANCGDAVSYEDSMMKTAKKANKEILGLETPQQQMTVLESIPTDSVVKGILDNIQHPNTDDHEYDKMLESYKKQDLPALYAFIMGSKEFGDNLDAFLDDRNKKWIARIEKESSRSSVFYAVGAGHLWGDNGVIKLLRREGYKVEPIK